MFARFVRFRTIFARFVFSRFFIRTDVRTFGTCLHDARTQAVGQRVCARFDRNSHKAGEIHSFRLAHPKILEFFAKKTLTNRNEFRYLCS